MYGYIMRAQQPIGAYQALHREVIDVAGRDDADGLLVHTAYATETGYALVEVWESKSQADAFNREVVGQALQRLGIPLDGAPFDLTEFEPVEMIIPRAYTSSSR